MFAILDEDAFGYDFIRETKIPLKRLKALDKTGSFHRCPPPIKPTATI